MAIALTPFTALCGFLPLQQISAYLSSVPEFASLIEARVISEFQSRATSITPDGLAEKSALKDVFSAVMTANPEQVASQLGALMSRYKTGNISKVEDAVHKLVIELESQYPNDVGVFCIFLLNVVKLEPGQAIFLGAGEPHAYISGGK
jgi:mannose-6-phosphate isomerase